MYRLYYHLKTAGDVLYCVMEPEVYPDDVRQEGNVVALFGQGKLIGYNFLHMSKTMKIHSEGMIPSPDDKMIDVLNSLLSAAGFEQLPYTRDSYFRVGQVESLEEHPLYEKKHIVHLKFGDLSKDTVSGFPLEEGQLVVAMMDGCLRYDGTRFLSHIERNIPIEVEICSGTDLRINDDVTRAFCPDSSRSGDDFFLN